MVLSGKTWTLFSLKCDKSIEYCKRY